MKNSRRDGVPGPPAGCGPAARDLWGRIVRGWRLDDAGLVILERACEALDRLHQARRILAKEGITVDDRFGQRKEHPSCATERGAWGEFRAAMRGLNLDVEPLHDQAGRPPGR